MAAREFSELSQQLDAARRCLEERDFELQQARDALSYSEFRAAQTARELDLACG
jgi:hypothetical protein